MTLWFDIRPDDLVEECKKLMGHVKRLRAATEGLARVTRRLRPT